MRTVLKRLVISVISLLSLALPVCAGQLDDYYLAQFGARPGGAQEKTVLLSPSTGAAQATRSGTPLVHALTRDMGKLEPATRKALAKYVSLPTLAGEQLLTSSGGHFLIHYTTSGADAPNLALINQYTGLGLASIADWAAQVGDRFEDAYAFYSGAGGLGYHPPPNFPGAPFNIYLISLASQGYYGLTQSDQSAPSVSYPWAFTSYIQIDKDFTNGVFTPTIYTPLQSLQVTSVHEFHHAIQYGYNFYFDVWYAEATSTWFENELYPGVLQLYSYLPGWFSNSTHQIDLSQSDSGFNSEAYGRWIFNRYLAESHGSAVVRTVWDKLAGMAPTGGADIPMVPVLDSVLSTTYSSSLGAEFFGFAKRVYTRDWTSHAADLAQIPQYAPVATYPARASSTALPASLTVTLNNTSGIRTALWKKAGGTVSEITADSGGGSYTVSNFGTLDPNSDEVVLLVVNATATDAPSVNISTGGDVANSIAAINASVTLPHYSFAYYKFNTKVAASTTGSSSGGGGGGGGCFIATAAYGSYLHPKVAELRAFRDRYLLTNAPGRLFVALYYRLSPPVAHVIAEHAWMRAVVRVALTPVIFAVEHPGGALLVFLLAGLGLVGRLASRRRAISFA
jgi:hypothetical protein